MSESNGGGGNGGSCSGCILGVLVLWALFVGLPTPWGVFNIDVFPPAIRLDGAAPVTSGAQ